MSYGKAITGLKKLGTRAGILAYRSCWNRANFTLKVRWGLGFGLRNFSDKPAFKVFTLLDQISRCCMTSEEDWSFTRINYQLRR